jgi:hypothetical protein
MSDAVAAGAGFAGKSEEALAGLGFAAAGYGTAGACGGGAATFDFLMARTSWVDKEFKRAARVFCGRGDATVEADTV